jgi:hypothetical protein
LAGDLNAQGKIEEIFAAAADEGHSDPEWNDHPEYHVDIICQNARDPLEELVREQIDTAFGEMPEGFYHAICVETVTRDVNFECLAYALYLGVAGCEEIARGDFVGEVPETLS